MGDGERDGLEKAAKLIDENAIVHGDETTLSPRRSGDINGLFYAAAIRALKIGPE